MSLFFGRVTQYEYVTFVDVEPDVSTVCHTNLDVLVFTFKSASSDIFKMSMMYVCPTLEAAKSSSWKSVGQ